MQITIPSTSPVGRTTTVGDLTTGRWYFATFGTVKAHYCVVVCHDSHLSGHFCLLRAMSAGNDLRVIECKLVDTIQVYTVHEDAELIIRAGKPV